MNYQVLKVMLEGMIKNYKCPFCSGGISDDNIEIVGSAGTTTNIDIKCPKCDKHSIIKAEITHLDPNILNLSPEDIEALKSNIGGIKEKLKAKFPGMKDFNISENIQAKKPKNLIKDEDIVKLNKKLKKTNITAEDLFGE